MSFLNKLLRRSASASLANPPQWLVEWFSGGRSTKSGTSVSHENALTYGAVFACVRVLAETIGSLPLRVYRRLPNGGKEKATNHYLYPILHSITSPQLTSMNWRMASQGHLATWGNAYSEIERDGVGRVVALHILRPDRMTVSVKGREKIYKYTMGNGTAEIVSPERVLHIPGFGFDGVVGYSIIALAREAIGLGLSTEDFGASFFGNGTHPGGMFEHPGKLSDPAYKRLKDELQEKHAGLGTAHKAILLEEGMKYQSIGIPPEDAQFLETRKFQVNEIARIYRVPLHMIQDLERATFSNIEHQDIGFAKHTIRPWCVLWEQELSRQLLSETDRNQGYFIEFSLDGLMRGDIKSRYDAYSVGRNGGWLSANDIRDFENMNPIDGGEQYLVPLNMVPADQVRAEIRSAIPDETRTDPKKQAKPRKRIIESSRSSFRRAAERIVNREVKAIGAAVEKELKRSAGSFADFLETFYRELPEHIRREFLPVIEMLAGNVAAAAAEEVNGAMMSDEDLAAQVSAYADTLAYRWSRSSLGQLREIIEQTPPEELPEALTTRLGEWGETRADKVEANESYRVGNAFTRFAFLAAGVTSLRWVTVGDKCPFCRTMDGKVVGITENFLDAGDGLEGEGANGPMKMRGNHAHPPIHRGCDCMIVKG